MTERRGSDTGVAAVAALTILAIALFMAAVGLAAESASEPPVVGSLGIGGLSFKGIYDTEPEDPAGTYSFDSEPRVMAVVPDGPAEGVLEVGDVIVAIDGLLITTSAGGRRFSAPPVDKEVRLTIRRRGREREVALVPVAVPTTEATAPGRIPAPAAAPAPPAARVPSTPGEAPVPPAVPEAAARMAPVPRPAPPAAPAPPAPVELDRLPRVGPEAWLGVGLTCSRCTITLEPDNGPMTWRFFSPPEVYSVDPDSPAFRAGLRRGDVITHVDGARLDSDEGSRRFSTLEPGEEVVWTVVRNGASRELRMQAGRLPVEPRAPAAPVAGVEPPPRPEAHLRWAGSLGPTQIEVRGLEQVMVSVREADREILITTSDSTIRLWQEE
jgi:hypothetical protein